MFTGIIEAVGRIAAVTDMARGLRVSIHPGRLDLGDVRLGDSIAVQGICLTVVELTGDGFAVDVSEETLRCTTLGECGAGVRVNLEKALCPGGRLGGHFVTGHVDGIGTVAAAQPGDPDAGMRIVVPEALVRYLYAWMGRALTVNRIEGREFEVHLIPHTLSATIAGSYRAGTRVNIEVDLLARYVESLLSACVGVR